MPWKHHRAKPVIGIIGGIGSGKSTVSRLFAAEGCAVIDSDALSHEILQTPEVRAYLREWLGPAVFDADGSVSRKHLGQLVFSDPAQLRRLNNLLHPKIAQRRAELMQIYLADPAIKAIVWDSPLLLESKLDRDCDALVFVSATDEIRLKRVAATRGWTAAELRRREKLQFSLDNKAKIADYYIDNSGEQASSLRQVQQVLSHLLATSG